MDEADLVDRLRHRDAAAFRTLVSAHHASMVRVAETYVPSRAVAEEVVQDTWHAVITGIGEFEGRSSVKTWMYQILLNKARTRGVREQRTVPVSSLACTLDDELSDEPTVSVERFTGPHGRGVWAQPPARWSDLPEAAIDLTATLDDIRRTVRTLPENQRRVLVLRDIEGWSSAEVCAVLELTEGNQRVLLHRARSSVRAALEERLGRDAEDASVGGVT